MGHAPSDRVSGGRGRRTGWCAVGSSCTGAPSRRALRIQVDACTRAADSCAAVREERVLCTESRLLCHYFFNPYLRRSDGRNKSDGINSTAVQSRSTPYGKNSNISDHPAPLVKMTRKKAAQQITQAMTFNRFKNHASHSIKPFLNASLQGRHNNTRDVREYCLIQRRFPCRFSRFDRLG